MSWTYEVVGCNFGTDGGPYVTPAALDSARQHLDALTLHVKMKHELSGRSSHIQDNKGNIRDSSKLTEKYVRPTLEDKCTEEDWRFFRYKWEKYKTAADLAGSAIVAQLYACLSSTADE